MRANPGRAQVGLEHSPSTRAYSIILALVTAACLVAACSSDRSVSSGSTATTPAWAAALGPEVTIRPPGSNPSGGTSSPGGAVKAELAAFTSGHLSSMCSYIEPSVQSKCSSAVAGVPAAGVSYEHFALGFIAIRGTQALVGTLGTDCEPNMSPRCVTNSDPASIFSSYKTFDSLYSEAVASEAAPQHAYALIPCVKVASHWYVFLLDSSF